MIFQGSGDQKFRFKVPGDCISGEVVFLAPDRCILAVLTRSLLGVDTRERGKGRELSGDASHKDTNPGHSEPSTPGP